MFKKMDRSLIFEVKKGKTEVLLLLLVVESQGPPNWLSKASFNWYHIKELTVKEISRALPRETWENGLKPDS